MTTRDTALECSSAEESVLSSSPSVPFCKRVAIKMKEIRTVLGSSAQVSTWSLEKKYSAALFFLNRMPSSAVNEAQYHRLHALMLQIAYGDFVASGRLPEFSNCSASDRRKRESEWKALQHLQKVPAMKQFIDLMNELHPNWHKHRRVAEEFEFVWIEERQRQQSKQASESRRPGDSVHERLYQQRQKHHKDKSLMRAPSVVSAALAELQQYEERRLEPISPKLPKLSATLDARQTLSLLKGNESPRELHDVHSESRYYHTVRARPEEDFQHAKDVLENYFGSMSSGSVSEPPKKAGFEIRSDLEKSLLAMLQRLELAKTRAVTTDVRFPLVAVSKVEELLRPKLEIQTVLFGHLEELLSTIGPRPTILTTLSIELAAAIDSLFEYMYDVENSLKDLGEQCKDLQKQLDTTIATVKTVQELHSVDNHKFDLFGLTKAAKSQYEMDYTAGLAALQGAAKEMIEGLEVVLRSQKAEYFQQEIKLTSMESERDKLIDEIRMIQQTAYSDNIILANLAKDLKRSVGIIQGGEGRGSSHELMLKKELTELRKELWQLRRENDELRKGRIDDLDIAPPLAHV